MKIYNYNKGYIPTFDCVIHGTLEVSKAEFKKLLPLLKKHSFDYTGAITKNYLVDERGNHYYSFGVTPMEKIAKKYGLKYKPQNYQIKLLA